MSLDPLTSFNWEPEPFVRKRKVRGNAPSDFHHVVKVPDEIWEKLKNEAQVRGFASRAKFAQVLLSFMLDNPEAIDVLLGGEDDE